MQTPELQRWLQLTLAYKLDAVRLKQLRELAPTVAALFAINHATFCEWGMPAHAWPFFSAWQQGTVDAAVERLVDESLEWGTQPAQAVITLGDSRYPPLLATCIDAPPQLFVWGDPDLLSLPQIAMVGSRKPSVDGCRHARRFAAALVERGYQITSGLALGIDTESHRGALESAGKTIAVLGSGLASIYPKSNLALAEQIAQQGAVVSEFPPGTNAYPGHFPERNRIISGLSHGVVVVEAAEQSGSLITARLAAEQGREVFAIPGSINNPLSRGCHRLIRQGARLVESPAEIIEELPALVAWERSQTASPTRHQSSSEAPGHLQRELPPIAKTVLQHLGYDPVSLDSLLLHCEMAAAELLPVLTQLELCGLVEMREQAYVLSARG
jgi:DNA processing protein